MLSPGKTVSSRLLRPALWLPFRLCPARTAVSFMQKELIKKRELEKDELRPLYMDFQATTPMDPRVLDAMLPYQVNYYGNPHSRTHAYGWESETAMETARKQVASLIGADPREIIFTSGATESNNMAIKGVARFYQAKKRHVITTQTEHKCVLDSCRILEAEGFTVTYLPVQKNGLLDLKLLEASIRPETSLVSVMTINNEIGVKQPIKEIGQICRSKGVFFHTDAAQAVGKIPISVSEWKGLSYVPLVGQRSTDPKAWVLCMCNADLDFFGSPAAEPGGGQERGLRSGTVPPPAGCWGWELHGAMIIRECPCWTNRLWPKKIMDEIPDVVMNFGDPKKRKTLMRVCLYGFSACTSASLEPSYVLRAIGADEDLAHSSIRKGIDLKSIKGTQH
ncbi:cysteine desulfurase [Crenichthys baileyi]|uniref:cysteine desulfurase n=1 Tax=Crenichthys baileyi TaxID=28760 RepID=A0AAV9SPK4_9TELE